MNDFLSTPIEFLKGVGPQRAELLKKELNIHTFEQLLNHFPFRYIDKSFYNTISELPYNEGHTQLKGRIVGIDENTKGKQKRLTVKKIDAGNAVTIQANGSELIDGSASHVLNSSYAHHELISQGGDIFLVT